MCTSFVIIPTFIGEVEQDYLYWPLKYKALACQRRETTDWAFIPALPTGRIFGLML
jgi:hypothetical protein